VFQLLLLVQGAGARQLAAEALLDIKTITPLLPEILTLLLWELGLFVLLAVNRIL
jgi:hypothetical protein